MLQRNDAALMSSKSGAGIARRCGLAPHAGSSAALDADWRAAEGTAHPAQGRHRPLGRPEGRRFRARRRADRGRQDPRGPPDIAAGDAGGDRCREPHPHPRLCRHPQPFLSGPAAHSLANGLVDPDYNRDVQNKLTPAYSPDDVYAGVLITALGFIEMGTTAIIDLSQISHTPEHSDACIRRCRIPASARSMAIRAARARQAAMAAGHRPIAEDLFQLEGSAADAGARREPRREGARGGARGAACRR